MQKTVMQFIFLCFFVSNSCFSQKNTAEFDDGTKIDYEIIDKSPDKMNRYNISLLNGLNFSYFQPNHFLVMAKYNYWKFGAEGTFFYTSFEEEKARKHTIKSESTGYRTITNYIIKPVVTIKTYLGIHTGYYYSDYNNTYNATFNGPGIKTNEAFAGLSLTRARFTKLILNYGDRPRKIQGTMQINFYADLVYFFGSTYTPDYTEYPEYTNLSDFSTKIGYRIYMDGKSTISRTNDIGLTWKLGYQSGPYKSQIINILTGIGFYVGF